MADLSVVLGARFYLREAEYAYFGDVLRELDAELPYPSRALAALTVPPASAHQLAIEACPPNAAWTQAASVRVARRANGDDTPLPPNLVELLIAHLLRENR